MVLDEAKFIEIAERNIDESNINNDELKEFVEVANLLYRGGYPIVSDGDYDLVFLDELKNRNIYDETVEPEAPLDENRKTVELPVRMLSTDKAYAKKDIEQWADRIKKDSSTIGKKFDSLTFKVTPKLDGYAAYDDGKKLYTRGDGKRGTDITRAFNRGLAVAEGNKRGLGSGEIVVNRKYFDEHLSDYFDNARNFQASVIKEKDLDAHVLKAIKDKAAIFYPFSLLPSWQGTWEELIGDFEAIIQKIWGSVEYDVDGVVIEITDEELKSHMGFTQHHYRWQIAYKENLYKAETEVIQVIPQTSRLGRINPVAEVKPTFLSGATIQRVLAHHYKMVKEKGIGPGAIIEITRSGEVVPKIERVIRPANPQIPKKCPSCGSPVKMDGDFLYCTNSLDKCPAQTMGTIQHFFEQLRNVDGFAEASLQTLYDHGIRSIEQIYKLTAKDFQSMGFGPKQAENFIGQLKRSRIERIEDSRFLSAFGVLRLGSGYSEKLLSAHKLEDIFALTADDLAKIKGFSINTGEVVVADLKRLKPTILNMLKLGFNLERTVISSEASSSNSPITGKLIVFTGTMLHGDRSDMEKEAKTLGAKIGKEVSSKTDWLVTGQKPGGSKLTAAKENNVKILSEEEYQKLLSSDFSVGA